jgi:hypothetical protein
MVANEIGKGMAELSVFVISSEEIVSICLILVDTTYRIANRMRHPKPP